MPECARTRAQPVPTRRVKRASRLPLSSAVSCVGVLGTDDDDDDAGVGVVGAWGAAVVGVVGCGLLGSCALGGLVSTALVAAVLSLVVSAAANSASASPLASRGVVGADELSWRRSASGSGALATLMSARRRVNVGRCNP